MEVLGVVVPGLRGVGEADISTFTGRGELKRRGVESK